MRTVTTLAAAVLLSVEVCALEPVSAIEDGFAVPSGSGMAEASFFYPGSEFYINRGFVSGAWSVPFGIEDLAVTTFHAGVAAGKFGMSVSYSGSGFDLYGDEQEKLGVSFSPASVISTGMRITRNAMRIRGFGNASAWSCDAGVVLKPLDTVYIAGAYEDIFGAELGKSHEPLDGRLRFAASWKTPGDVTLLVSVTKVRRFDPSFTGGFSAEVLNILTLGVAGANEPDRMEFLCGVRTKGTVFSYRGCYHSELEMTHGFSVSWGAGITFPQAPRE